LHLARRSYLLVMLAAVLAVLGIWSDERDLTHLWRLPVVLLLAGIAIEGALTRRLWPQVRLTTAARAFLGRQQPASFEFANDSARRLTLEYAPAMPAGVESEAQVRRLSIAPRHTGEDEVTLLPLTLGVQRWPALPARMLGPLGLVWWGRTLPVLAELQIAPELFQRGRQVRGLAAGARARRVAGAGQELHQLRGYVRGDPLARIDWKATARNRAIVTREYSEDQHLDIFVAIDAGRLSRVRDGSLDRLGLYANVTASFAQLVTRNDDRIGMVVYADQVLASCGLTGGLPAVTRVRQTLENLQARPAESDPAVAAVSIRRLVHQRALVVLLTDLDDVNISGALLRAVRLLAPPHLVMVAGVHSGEVQELARSEAREWQDPWVALAAGEHEQRALTLRALLRRRGVEVVSATAAGLQAALFERYETLRRARRI
jgi:uncharacterized protein (DUF58 family)